MIRLISRTTIVLATFGFAVSTLAAEPNTGREDKFRQLEEILPTPTTIRTASGAPGAAYWQQRADYSIRATLDETRRTITGAETITYHNNSPDALSYLWVQLDQNIYKKDSDARTTATVMSREAWANAKDADAGLKFDGLRGTLEAGVFDGGYNIGAVKDASGRPLHYIINRTMMRIDLPQPLKPAHAWRSRASGTTRSTSRKCSAGVPATRSSTKTKTIYTKSPSGFRAWRRTTTPTAGSTSSSWARANSRWSSATMTSS